MIHPVELGCFIDNRDRDLGPGWKSNAMTLEMCFQRCRSQNYVYAGLQAADWCHCGNSFGKHGSVASGECNSECKGNKGTMCGGPWRNRIYHVGELTGSSDS